MPNQLIKKINRAVGSITKVDISSQKTGKSDIGSEGNAIRDISVPGDTTIDIGSGKGRDDSSVISSDLFQSRKMQHADDSNALNLSALKMN